MKYPTRMEDSVKKHYDRYYAAAHAMQSAVAFSMQMDPAETTPKHLRVGVNAAMVEHGALVGLLLKKGLITEEEFYEALADKMEAEVESYRVKFPGHVQFA